MQGYATVFHVLKSLKNKNWKILFFDILQFKVMPQDASYRNRGLL